MIVFEFFFDKMGVFGPKMDEKVSLFVSCMSIVSVFYRSSAS